MAFVTRDGTSIHYEIKGEGPTIVKVPGLGANMEMSELCGWVSAFPDYRLILVDPRGHGKSDRPKDPYSHRIEEYREDVHAVLDASNGKKAIFWGTSDGAQVCCAFAQAYPDRVTAVIDLDGFDDRDLCDSPIREGRLDLARTVRTRGWSTVIRELAPSRGISSDSPLIKEFQKADSEMVALELEEWTHWKGPVSILPELKAPILRLMNGTRNRDELDRSQHIAVGISEFFVIPGVNHLRLCLEPEHTLPIIRDFLLRLNK